ncbi:hypothetical protein Droror1_Dr00023815 [Drosera rotundifolia]
MDGNLEISIDKLPLKRLEYIDENGVERFPADVGYDEKRVDLIQRIDFAWAVEKDAKKQKTSSSKEASSAQWPWQSLAENLQLAQQELSVIIDLISTVEADDAVSVSVMSRPKPLANEALADLAVSTATKLQCFRHLGKYFKQSATALEQQIAREGRFYGALIRLQQNWKVKRHRLAASAPGSEGFLIDLFDSSGHDQAVVSRPSSISMVRVDHDSAGMLTVNVPPNSCHSIHFGFLGFDSGEMKPSILGHAPKEMKDTASDDDSIRATNSALCEAHKSIFHEMVFDSINREAFNPSLGVNVTGMRDNYLQLAVTPGVSVYMSLISSEKDSTSDQAEVRNIEVATLPLERTDGTTLTESKQGLKKASGFPSRMTYQIFLEQLFHKYLFIRMKDRPSASARHQPSMPVGSVAVGLVSHFCASLAHRMFADKVLSELENLVTKVPYLELVSRPTWNSRSSSWTLTVRVPQSILSSGSYTLRSEDQNIDSRSPLFQTLVVVREDRIILEGESASNGVGPFKSKSDGDSSISKLDCDLLDLSMMLLLQVASRIVGWLHEEAVMVGIKTTRDFLSLSFELDQGEIVRLMAHVDPDNVMDCISWWLVVDDGSAGDNKVHAAVSDRRFLGHLSLEMLYSNLMDLITLYNGAEAIDS